MSDKYFLDTNVFVYSFENADKEKHKRKKSRALIKQALVKRVGFISFQVIQEFLNVAIKKFKTDFSLQDNKVYLSQVLYSLCEIFPTEGLYSLALDIQATTQYGFYDSLILAAAVESQCNIVYTEDLCHERQVRGVKILNPFE